MTPEEEEKFENNSFGATAFFALILFLILKWFFDSHGG